MAFIPVPNAIKLTVTFTLGGQLVNLTLGLEKASAVTPSDLTAACNGGIDWASTELLPHLSNQIALTGAEAYDLSSSSAPTVKLSTASPIVGVVNAISTPANAAGVISFRTGGRGRSSRGRIYVPGFPQTAVQQGVFLDAGTVGALLDAGNKINTYFTGVPLNHVVISRYTNNAPRITGVTEPVTGIVVDNRIDSQRRRLAGRGI